MELFRAGMHDVLVSTTVIEVGVDVANATVMLIEDAERSGKLKPGGISQQTQATLENIARIVQQAGFELKDIVAVNVYLADINEFPDMNKVYKSFLPDPKPTRTTVQAAGLVNHARIEISAIAVKEH